MSSWPYVVLLLATRCLYWGGVKTIKMAWDLCSSLPCIPFYPYTIFQNPMHKPSSQKSRKASITQKVLVTQSSNIVNCDWHTQKPTCSNFQSFLNTFPCSNWRFFFFHFWSGWLKQTAKNFTFCWFWLGKMHHNGLSGAYLGFKACQIQWHLFHVSMISSSWKIKILGDK